MQANRQTFLRARQSLKGVLYFTRNPRLAQHERQQPGRPRHVAQPLGCSSKRLLSDNGFKALENDPATDDPASAPAAAGRFLANCFSAAPGRFLAEEATGDPFFSSVSASSARMSSWEAGFLHKTLAAEAGLLLSVVCLSKFLNWIRNGTRHFHSRLPACHLLRRSDAFSGNPFC